MKRFIMTTFIIFICKAGLMAYGGEAAQDFDGEEIFEQDTLASEPYSQHKETRDTADAAAQSSAPSNPSGEPEALSNDKTKNAQTADTPQGSEQTAGSAAAESNHERKVYVTASIGTAGFINLESRNTPYCMQYGYVMSLNPFVNGKLTGELTTDFKSAVFAAVECGAEILIGGNKHYTPFFGSGLGLAAARGDGKHTAGITMSTNGGVYLFRTDLYQVNLQGRLCGLLSQIDGKYPFSYSVKIGVMF